MRTAHYGQSCSYLNRGHDAQTTGLRSHSGHPRFQRPKTHPQVNVEGSTQDLQAALVLIDMQRG